MVKDMEVTGSKIRKATLTEYDFKMQRNKKNSYEFGEMNI